MRFGKLLFVLSLVFLLGAVLLPARIHHSSQGITADGTSPVPTPWHLADGTSPVPKPWYVADGTSPVPKPWSIADGTSPVPTPWSGVAA